jgi:hypothetical protein
MAAPVTAIVAYDLAFYERFGKLTPYVDIAKFAATAPEKIEENAFRNSTLQGAYLIIAARALGLAFDAMSGFDNTGLDREFFPDGKIKSNFCAISASVLRTAHARAPHGWISTSSANPLNGALRRAAPSRDRAVDPAPADTPCARDPRNKALCRRSAHRRSGTPASSDRRAASGTYARVNR